jgi:hypothetical protein
MFLFLRCRKFTAGEQRCKSIQVLIDLTVLGQRARPDNEIEYTHCHWPIPHHVFGFFTPLFIFYFFSAVF